MRIMTRKWFTLVEMLIVVVIIGILASALVPRLTWAQASARDSARAADLNQIWTAIQMYHWNHWAFPNYSWAVATGGDSNSNGLADDLVPRHIDSLPTDPQSERPAPAAISGDNNGEVWWQYRYTYVESTWTARGWWVVAANIEQEGSAANWTGTAIDEGDDVQSDIVEKLCDAVYFDGENGDCSLPEDGDESNLNLLVPRS